MCVRKGQVGAVDSSAASPAASVSTFLRIPLTLEKLVMFASGCHWSALVLPPGAPSSLVRGFENKSVEGAAEPVQTEPGFLSKTHPGTGMASSGAQYPQVTRWQRKVSWGAESSQGLFGMKGGGRDVGARGGCIAAGGTYTDAPEGSLERLSGLCSAASRAGPPNVLRCRGWMVSPFPLLCLAS